MLCAPSSVMGLSEIERLRRRGLVLKYCARHSIPGEPMRFWPKNKVSTSACALSACRRQRAPVVRVWGEGGREGRCKSVCRAPADYI